VAARPAGGVISVAITIGVLRYRLLGIVIVPRRTLLHVPLLVSSALVAVLVAGDLLGRPPWRESEEPG
jgi:hypothetical protein